MKKKTLIIYFVLAVLLFMIMITFCVNTFYNYRIYCLYASEYEEGYYRDAEDVFIRFNSLLQSILRVILSLCGIVFCGFKIYEIYKEEYYDTLKEKKREREEKKRAKLQAKLNKLNDKKEP